jgi:hypothetical protein
MKSWEKRPPEVANLYNPAFYTVLLQNAIKGYQSVLNLGMPFPLIFVVLPIVLHPKTRDILPNSINKRFYTWLTDYPEVHIRFASRARSLVPYTKESIAFGIKQQIFQISDNGKILLVPKTRLLQKPNQIWSNDSEAYQCYLKANFVGKWFTKINDISNIFVALGIRP